MSKFDYENFLKKIQENNETFDDSEDCAGYYEELHNFKEKQRILLKAQLNTLQKKNRVLKNKYELNDVFNRELLRTRESITQANSILCKEIIDAEEARREALAKHIDAMEKLEGCYFDFTKIKCDSNLLKAKLAELKENKSDLQDEFKGMSKELQHVTKSMNDLNMPLPNAEAVKRIAEETLMECGDLSAKQQELEKMKRFLKDFQEKINLS